MVNRTILECPVKFDRTSFFDLFSLSAAAMISRQNKMGELVVGDNNWSYDIRNRQLAFGGNRFSAGILGTENEREHTWLWAWANTESNLPELAAAPSRRARRALAGVQEFSEGKFMLEDELHTAHNLAMVSCAVNDKPVCYYRCPYDGGAMFVQPEGLPVEVFAPVSQTDLMRTFLEVIGALYCDHRLLAAGFLYMNGNEFIEEEDSITAQIDGRRLKFTFEKVGELSRTADISQV